MKLGYASRCINPTLPVALSGFGKKRIAHQIHDDLMVRVLTFRDQGKITCIAQYDLVCIDQILKTEICKCLKEYLLKEEDLFLFATHTHSGPVGTADNREGILKGLEVVFGNFGSEYVSRIAKESAHAFEEAIKNETDFTVTLARSSVQGVGKERHSIELATDESLFVAEFKRIDGKQVLLYNYACHPTILNGDNLEITKDLPYGVEEKLKEEYDCIVFINGNCGDISTRFTRKEASFDQVLNFGNHVALAIKEALLHPYYQGACTKLNTKTEIIALKVKEVDCLIDATEKRQKQQDKLDQLIQANAGQNEIRVQASFVEGANTNCLLSNILEGMNEIKVSISCIEIHNTKILCVPGELFSTLSREWKSVQGHEVFGYCNGYILYIADEKAYDSEYYEALSSPLAKGQGEELVKKAIMLAESF